MNNNIIYNKYIELLNIIESNNLSITKLEALSILQGFKEFYTITENERLKLIDIIVEAFLMDDCYDYNLFNFIDEAITNFDEIKNNNFDFKKFIEILEKNLFII